MMRVQPATLGVSMGVVALVAAVVSPRGTTPEPKIPLCHATASLEHPYNLEDVDGDAIVLPDGEPTAHGTHTGPVYPAAGWGGHHPALPLRQRLWWNLDLSRRQLDAIWRSGVERGLRRHPRRARP